MNPLPLPAGEIVQHHAEWTARWHETSTPPETNLPWNVIEQNHRMNFDLWHAEDVARRDDLGPASVRDAKRTIDRCNQSRSDAIEQFDVWLLGQLPPARSNAPLHSETPGMIIDRLSILSLKLYHMRIEAARETATDEHRRKCSSKCAMLEEQHGDLKRCLQSLVAELQSGARQCKLYRQFKMYNDASLNPQLYQKPAKS
ncbi:MAG: DUF4254 domain-containing protein [Verrucomicrobiota bacterium]|jgi:hypothetical protein